MTSPVRPPESELAHFTSSVAKAADRPIFIYDKIQYKVKGDGRSREDFLDQYFENAKKAKTFGELTSALQLGISSLRSVGVYKNIVVRVEDMPSNLVEQYKNHCRVIVEIDEKKWYNAGVGIYFSEGVPEFKLEGALRNLGGRGETTFGRVSTTSDWMKSLIFTAGVMKPVHLPSLGRSAVFNVMAHNSIFDSMMTSNYSQRVSGANLRLDLLPHSLSYEASLRDTSLGPDPSTELKRDEGRSMKSAVRYSYSQDFRDNVVFPTKGQAYQFSSELAGLGGDVKFVKGEFSYNINIPFFKTGIAFNYILKGGAVAPLSNFYPPRVETPNNNINNNNNDNHVRVCDRFFLGGLGTALSLRGFKPRGIDTGNERESHGGDMYYTTAAHVTSPLPFLSHLSFVRAHVFANAGNLVLVKNGQFREAANELKEKARSAIGAGIIFTTPIGGRFEFNYCHPLRAFSGDKATKGFQFGITFTI